MAVTLEEITSENREAVLALHVAPGQEEFVSTVRDSLAEAAEYPHAKPWYRAVYASGEPAGPVGFVMVSWNAEPQPPEITGPWFLWKLLIDERYQGRGYGAAAVRHVAELVAAEGATELLTSYVPGDGGPAGFYRRLGFVPTGDLDDSGEVIVRLGLPPAHLCQHRRCQPACRPCRALIWPAPASTGPAAPSLPWSLTYRTWPAASVRAGWRAPFGWRGGAAGASASAGLRRASRNPGE